MVVVVVMAVVVVLLLLLLLLVATLVVVGVCVCTYYICRHVCMHAWMSVCKSAR